MLFFSTRTIPPRHLLPPSLYTSSLHPSTPPASIPLHHQVQSAESSPAQRKHSVYSPPTMKGREPTDCCRGHSEDRDSLPPTRLPQSHTDTLALADELSGDLPRLADTPRRKDTPYQYQPPFTPGKAITTPHIWSDIAAKRLNVRIVLIAQKSIGKLLGS
uniref:Uncharacterized protein n=1 Tax=Oncorhynchus mykiss TaxID=8022 RepID=A0A8C7VNN0_ONCMY